MWQDPLPSGTCQEHPGHHVGLLRGGRAGGEQQEAIPKNMHTRRQTSLQ